MPAFSQGAAYQHAHGHEGKDGQPGDRCAHVDGRRGRGSGANRH
jgi:hypothetical protein